MQGSGGVGRSIPAWTALLAAAASCLALAAPASGASLQTVGSYDRPIYVTSDPNDWTRLFVVERPGKIELTTPAGTTTFLDQTAITGLSGERGLLSMAFAPDFAVSHLFYVFYASDVDGSLHVDELRANGDVAVPSSRRSVLTIQHSNAGNHNGGQLQFGPDGYLYISTGDGGGGGDPLENAQDPDTLLGKILRIDPRQNGVAPYTVPPSNPFVGHSGADEVWSLGLRNPWRFSFDRENHALVIGDVGQSAWEEVDYRPQAAGGGRESNFGWDCREGRHDFETTGCGNLTLTEPMFEYPHTNGVCAITGGYVVRDPGIPELLGRYLYADLCAGQVRSLRPGLPDASDDRSEGLNVVQPATFGEDSCGRVYVASLSGGQVYRFVGAAPTNCGPPPQPTLTGTDPGSPANENNPEVTGTAQLGTTVSLYTDPDCGGSPVATGSASAFASPGIPVPVDDDAEVTLHATTTDSLDQTSPCSTSSVDYIEDSTAPQASIDGGPGGATNDPTPSFAFHGDEAGATFQCSVDHLAFTPCASPRTLPHLSDGWHVFSVRARDAAGNVQATAASRSFVVRTGDVGIGGSTLNVVAAPGAEDNLAITRPSPATIRVTDMPSPAFPGSGLEGAGACTRSGDYTVDCDATGVDSVRVLSRDQTDRVVNSADIESTLNGGDAPDVLVGGPRGDRIVGGAAEDSMRGMNGADVLLARDLTSDEQVNCDGGTRPGTGDRAEVDTLPRDPAFVILGCETATRR